MKRIVLASMLGIFLIGALLLAGTALAANYVDSGFTLPHEHGGLQPPAPPSGASGPPLHAPGPPGDPPGRPSHPGRVTFEGRIVTMTESSSEVWIISDLSGTEREVEVTDETKINPPSADPEPGDWVRVIARREDVDDGGDATLGLKDNGDDHSTLIAEIIVVEEHGEERARPLEFHGEIQVLPAESISGTWVVNEISVTVDAETHIVPPGRSPTVGMQANVIAFADDGSLWAKNISLQSPEEAESEVEFEGTIEALMNGDPPGLWVVDGISVTVGADTEISGVPPAVGLTVEVEGFAQGDGSVRAREVRVEGAERRMVRLEGEIQTMGGEIWEILSEEEGVVEVRVTADTLIDESRGDAQEGAEVEIKARRLTDGTLVAIRIRVEHDEDE